MEHSSNNTKFAIASFFLTLGMTAWFAPLWIMDYTHEAHTFKPAIDILNGRMIFRDIFTQYGAMPMLVNAGTMALFGPYLLVVKLTAAIFYAIAGASLYLTWRRILPASLALLSVVLWNFLSYHFLHPFLAWSSVYALGFQSIAIYAMTEYLCAGKSRWLLIAGGAAALSFLSKQNVGTYLFGALLVCSLLPLFRGQRVAAALSGMMMVVAGFAIPMGVFAVWLYANDAFGGWWLANIVWPAKWASVYGGSFTFTTFINCLTTFRFLGQPDPFNPPYNRPDLFFTLAPLIGTLVFFHSAAKLVLRRATELDVAVASLGLLCGASWLQYYPVPGIGHVWWSCAPMIGLVMYGGWRLSKYLGQYYRLQPRFVSAIYSAMIIILFVPPIVKRLERHGGAVVKMIKNAQSWGMTTAEKSPFRGLILGAEQARYLDKVALAISSFVAPEAPLPPILFSGGQGLYTTFLPQWHSFHPLWMIDTPLMFDLFPKYVEEERQFITEKHPLVFLAAPSSEADAFVSRFPGYRIASLTEGGVGATFIVLKWGDEVGFNSTNRSAPNAQ